MTKPTPGMTRSEKPEEWRQRVRSQVTTDGTPNSCWLWGGALDRDGYGRFRFTEASGVRRIIGAHRAAWLAFRGDLPAGLVIDHLCRVRNCVNPAHLDPVTTGENTRRSSLVGVASKKRGCSTHGFENGYDTARPSGYTAWICRICTLERSRLRKAKERAARAVGDLRHSA